MQESDEIGALATIVKDQQPSTVVEIGTAHGGTLYIWSRYLNADTIVAVDNSLYFKARARLFREFDGNIDYTFLNTSSHQQSTAEIISNTVSDEIDFLFIDGDHRYDGVKQDFELYSPLVSDGGIIAFHDIIEVDKPWMGVPTFWNEIKGQYQTDEIILPPNKERGGIGVIYK